MKTNSMMAGKEIRMIKYFDPNNIKPDIPGIVILSHGPMAIAIAKSAEVIFGGPIENIAAFGLEENDVPEEYREEFFKAIDRFPKDTVILMDIFGGSPCNQLMRYSKSNNIEVNAIAGISLPMVLNASFLRKTYSGKELIEKLINEGKDSIVNVSEMLK